MRIPMMFDIGQCLFFPFINLDFAPDPDLLTLGTSLIYVFSFDLVGYSDKHAPFNDVALAIHESNGLRTNVDFAHKFPCDISCFDTT